MKVKQLYCVKIPGGFVRDVCPITGEIESTRDMSQAEWNPLNVSNALASYCVGRFPRWRRFSIYSTRVTVYPHLWK